LRTNSTTLPSHPPSPRDKSLVPTPSPPTPAIAIAFIVESAIILVNASLHLGSHEPPRHTASLLLIAAPSCILLAPLAVAKLWLGAVPQLDSPSLRKDGVCSIVGAIMAFCVALSAGIRQRGAGHNSWWTDGAVAIVVALCLLVYGLRTLVKNYRANIRWWRGEFWRGGGGR